MPLGKKRKKIPLGIGLCLVLAGALYFNGCADDDGGSDSPAVAKVISTPEDLAKIGVDAEYPLSGHYTLDANIALTTWTPVGTDGTPFTGRFDGGGNTIALNSFDYTADYGGYGALKTEAYIGIFGYTKGASIKNVTVASSVDVDTAVAELGQAVGLVVGCAENTVIDGITLTGSFDFTSAKTLYIGGVVGYIKEGTVVKNCRNTMAINVDGGMGDGVLAMQPQNLVGGIVGLFNTGSVIESCTNTGAVTADCTTAPAQVFVGGIAGGSRSAMDTAYRGYITGCSSTGTVTGTAIGSWTYAGGIAGYIAGDGGDSANDSNTTRIVRSYATGTVTVAATGSDYPYVGGIVGYNYYGGLVSQCYFNGTVTGPSSAKTGEYTGGIAGYNSQSAGHQSRVEDCWSAGMVTGYNNAGGIVGQNQVNTYLRRCYSTATVSTTGNNSIGTGGIVGITYSTNPVTACVALNTEITTSAGSGNKIHRIAGDRGTPWGGEPGVLGSNKAASTPTGGGYSADKGADKVDGEDCVAKPAQSVYESMGWDFGNVWKMGSDGYPLLKWQS